MTDEQELFTIGKVATMLAMSDKTLRDRVFKRGMQLGTVWHKGRALLALTKEQVSQCFDGRTIDGEWNGKWRSLTVLQAEALTVAQVIASRCLSREDHQELLDWATEPEKEYRGLLSAPVAARLIAKRSHAD